MRRTLVVLLLLVGGVARADNKPAPEMSSGDVSKWLTFFDKLVGVVVSDSSAKCSKLAGDVNVLVDANQDAVAVARAAHDAGKRLPPDAQEHVMAGVKKMIPAMQKCGQDDKVRAAFSKLDLTRKDTAARR